MSDETTSWSLDLDVSDASEKAEGFKETIDSLGDSEGLVNLAAKLGEVGIIAGTIGAAFFALKETFDLVFDAEEITAVNQQFEMLSKNAGVMGSTLKEALIDASGGLVDETTLLKGANQALVEMNGTADQLPQIMTIARQATAVFGGDLMQNFNGISQAIASGNTRMLKHLGIVVDQQKAYKDYAESIGVAATELDAAGKSHAILNAVLEKSATAYAGVNVNVKQATNLWAETKVTFTEFGEAFTIFFGSVFGPTVIQAITVLKQFATDLKNVALAAFGDESQKAAGKIKGLHSTMDDATKQIAYYQQALEHPTKFQSAESLQKALDFQKKRLETAGTELEKYEQKKQQIEQKGEEGSRALAAAAVKDSGVNDQERLKNTQKFQAEIDKLKEASLAEDLKNTQSSMRAEQIGTEQKKALETKLANDIAKIKLEMAGHDKQSDAMVLATKQKAAADEEKIDQAIFTKKSELLKQEMALARNRDQVDKVAEQQKAAIAAEGERRAKVAMKLYESDEKRQATEILAIKRRTANQIAAIDAGLVKQEEAADQKEIEDAEGVAETISKSFKASSKQAGDDLSDMGKLGGQAFNTLSSNAVSAFEAMGNGSKSAADAMKDFVLNSVGQEAIARGTVMLLSGVWPPDPVALAGGAALIAFGSSLTSAGGGGSSAGAPSAAASSSSSNATATGPDTSGTANAGPSTATANPEQNVNFVVQGNMYNSTEAKTAMLDLMRSATDATGYKYQQVGTSS